MRKSNNFETGKQRGVWMKRSFALTLLVAILALILPGCGGETRGTGGTRVAGIVNDASGLPLAGVVLSSASRAEVAVTASDGSFDFEADPADIDDTGDLAISFEKNGSLATGAIVDPGQGSSVTVAVRVNFPERRADITVVSISTPTATPQSSPTARPTAQPTATVSPSPTPLAENPTPTSTASATPSPCAADFDHNGTLNESDRTAFNAAFANGDLAADFDGDGFVTGEDFDAYEAAFNLGC